MFSKCALSILALILTVLNLTACDSFLKGRSNEDKKADNTVVLSAPELECLKSTPQDFQKFLDDEGTTESFNQSIACVQQGLKTFMRLTRGSQPDAYLSKELQYFFNTFLLKENKINDHFQKEIMKIKVVAVGGSPDVVTKLELNQFIEFLDKVKSPLQKLQGKMRIILFKAEPKEVLAPEVQAANTDLRAFVEFLLQNTKISASRYQWSDLTSFLTDLNGFVETSKALTPFLKYIPLADSAKILFFGESSKLLSDSDWERAAQWVLQLYSTASQFHYFVNSKSFEDPAQSRALVSAFDQLLLTLQTAPVMKEKKIFEASAIDQVIDEAFKVKVVETSLTAPLLKTTYRKFFAHFLEVQAGRGDEQSISGLTENHLRVLTQEYTVWKLSQTFLIQTYAAHPNLSIVNLRWYVTRFSATEALDPFFLQQEEVQRSWKDFQNIIMQQPGTTYTADKKLKIDFKSDADPMPFVAASELNLIRTYTRLVHRGYGDRNAKAIFDKSLTRQSLMNLEEDFREFGRAVGLLDPRVTNAGSRTFDQGNFFAYHGNGDDRLTSTETYEIISHLVSGGGAQLTELYADLEKRNCFLPEKDVFKKNFVREDCFYQSLKERYSVYMNQLPGMVRFFQSLNDQQWASTYQALLSLSKATDHVQGRLDSGEIRTLCTVLNFVESLMVIYDKNQNDRLTESEVVAASPRFQKFIANISPLRDFLVEDIFVYLVFNGQKPGALDLVPFVAKRKLGFDLGEVGKFNLIQLLSVLNNDSK